MDLSPEAEEELHDRLDQLSRRAMRHSPAYRQANLLGKQRIHNERVKERARIKAQLGPSRTRSREPSSTPAQKKDTLRSAMFDPFKELWADSPIPWKLHFAWWMLRSTLFAPMTWIGVIFLGMIPGLVGLPVLTIPTIVIAFPVAGYFRLLNTLDKAQEREREAKKAETTGA